MLKTGKEMAPLFVRLLVKEKLRSLSFGRDLISAIFTTLIIFLMLFYLVGIGLYLKMILSNVLEIQDIPSFLSRAVIFYFLAEFIFRLFFQKKPTFDLNQYLHLPIKRSGIIHFLLSKSLISAFSLAVIILFLPTTLSEFAPIYGTLSSMVWLGTLVILSISLHWLTFWLKEIVAHALPGFLTVLALATLPFLLLYFDFFNLGIYTASFFSSTLSGPFSLIVSFIICLLFYRLTFKYYAENAYLDQKESDKTTFLVGTDTGLFARFGIHDVIVKTELKLILRHRKSRNYLFLSLFFLLYFLLIWDTSGTFESSFGFQLFLSLFVTGIFAINYGQFAFSWSAPFFDFFVVKKHGLKNLVRTKLYILNASCIILYVLSMPFLYYGWEILLVLTVAALYNIGIGVPVILLMSLWNPKPMNINKSAFFNYEGVGISQFLMAIPYIIAPLLIYLPLTALFSMYTAIIWVGIAGLAGLAFQKQIVNKTAQILIRNRYKISSIFRRGTL